MIVGTNGEHVMFRVNQPQCNKRTAYTDLYIFIEFELEWMFSFFKFSFCR